MVADRHRVGGDRIAEGVLPEVELPDAVAVEGVFQVFQRQRVVEDLEVVLEVLGGGEGGQPTERRGADGGEREGATRGQPHPAGQQSAAIQEPVALPCHHVQQFLVHPSHRDPPRRPALLERRRRAYRRVTRGNTPFSAPPMNAPGGELVKGGAALLLHRVGRGRGTRPSCTPCSTARTVRTTRFVRWGSSADPGSSTRVVREVERGRGRPGGGAGRGRRRRCGSQPPACRAGG